MAIIIQAKPIDTVATLTVSDFASLKAAIQPLLQLPTITPDLSKLSTLSIVEQSDGTAKLRVRFNP
jgi:hypothetical protein